MPRTSTTMKPGETRNPNGRPKKGESLTETMRTFLENIPEGQTKTYKELFIAKCFQKAYEGDPTFGKLVWNYMEGMPKQQTDITSGGESIQPLLVQFVGEHADNPDTD